MPVDLRTRKLAQLAVRYCVGVKPNEHVMISGNQESLDFLIELYKEIILRGAYPVLKFGLPNVSDFFYKHAKDHQIKKFPDMLWENVQKCQRYIGINTDQNTRELTSANPKKLSDRTNVTHKISSYICNEKDKIRRVGIAYPCVAHAQEAEMSFTEWENFVYDACLGVDWKKFGKRLDKISKVFEKAKNVHLIGEGVDLKFSIKGKNCVASKGKENMPDGEVFMAPVRESMEGWIKFDYPSIESGKEVSDIFLKFEKGKVIEAKASKNEDFLHEMLKTDANSSYVGEFGIGCNPKITKYSKNLLFDEKIMGTIHLALGMAYKDNGGGNDSNIHWDIVKDMRKAKIVLDGKVVQANGKWKI
jgi:aminopeptidase